MAVRLRLMPVRLLRLAVRLRLLSVWLLRLAVWLRLLAIGRLCAVRLSRRRIGGLGSGWLIIARRHVRPGIRLGQ